MKRWIPILTAAVITAAFLGPGTITTAARAGAGHGFELLWALVFATVACLVLQEACARLTIASGRTLGQALRHRFDAGWQAVAVLWLVLGAILLGCAAYEAGNILGGVAGAQLALPWSKSTLTLLSGVLAAALLWRGETRQITAVLGALVALMGGAFLLAAVLLRPDLSALVQGLLVPRVPEGAGLLAVGLVGTTVVPYNLFLGSGLAKGGDLRDTRFGLLVAIGLGGLISMAVVVVGAAVVGEFGYAQVAAVLESELGPGAGLFFALGLFAAGFTSAVTAPLAAAYTARSLFAGPDDPSWGTTSWNFRGVWLGVLLVGLGFGLAGVSPVPAIILAQALNGMLLPVVGIFLFTVMNDRQQLGDAVNGRWANLVLGAVVLLTIVLGARGVLAAASKVSNLL